MYFHFLEFRVQGDPENPCQFFSSVYTPVFFYSITVCSLYHHLIHFINFSRAEVSASMLRVVRAHTWSPRTHFCSLKLTRSHDCIWTHSVSHSDFLQNWRHFDSIGRDKMKGSYFFFFFCLFQVTVIQVYAYIVLIGQRSQDYHYLSVTFVCVCVCALLSCRHFPVLGTNALCQRPACRYQTTWTLPAVQTLQGKRDVIQRPFAILFIFWLRWEFKCTNFGIVCFTETGIWRISHKTDLKTGDFTF